MTLLKLAAGLTSVQTTPGSVTRMGGQLRQVIAENTRVCVEKCACKHVQGQAVNEGRSDGSTHKSQTLKAVGALEL